LDEFPARSSYCFKWDFLKTKGKGENKKLDEEIVSIQEKAQ
jgi:hypothetical protein